MQETNGHPPMGQVFRSKRRQLGLTMEVLAAKAGVSKPYLSLIETGRAQNPSDSVILWLCDVLQLDGDEMRARKYVETIPPELRQRVGRMIAAAEFKARAGSS